MKHWHHWLVLVLFLASSTAWGQGFTSERFTVTVSGSGSDVILIPGIGFSPRVWSELVQAVPDHRYHLIHISGFAGIPAHGNAKGLVAAPIADALAKYISAAKLNRPAVIGHSLGGSIGLMLAARHPQSISRLVVVDMPPFMGALFGPQGASADSVRPTADGILAQTLADDPATKTKATIDSASQMINTEAMRPVGLRDLLASDPEVSARVLHELMVTDLRLELASIEVPTKVLYVKPKGVPLTDTQIDGFYSSQYALLKEVVLVRIPESAHLIMWDQPQRFQKEVTIFLPKM